MYLVSLLIPFGSINCTQLLFILSLALITTPISGLQSKLQSCLKLLLSLAIPTWTAIWIQLRLPTQVFTACVSHISSQPLMPCSCRLLLPAWMNTVRLWLLLPWLTPLPAQHFSVGTSWYRMWAFSFCKSAHGSSRADHLIISSTTPFWSCLLMFDCNCTGTASTIPLWWQCLRRCLERLALKSGSSLLF